jgi:pyrroloquinoline-quinone synthase
VSVNKSVWKRIEESRERWNVLRHPFYQRWEAGELTQAELADYSGQYRHAVEAIATLSDAAASAAPQHAELRDHAAEEREHVRLWDGFVDSVGGSASADARSETELCSKAWTAHGDAVEHLARLYAIESGQPEISRTKLRGLAEHYGVTKTAGTAYFTVHSTRDIQHATEARELLEQLAEPGDEDRIVAAAETAFRANWRLLDGIPASA